ncbi:MAG: alpha/beta hydrolase [Alphaproteobacteria bacterium]
MKAQSLQDPSIQMLVRPGKPTLAYIYTESDVKGKKLPLLMFCGGYRSDMNGTKASYLEEQCRKRGQAYVRFDYSGHGQSEGDFSDGTIGGWMYDALDVLNHISPSGPVVLVGSSMGGWIALLMALRWTGTLLGFVGIAAAPDFTKDLYGAMTPAQKRTLDEAGIVAIENDYSDTPYEFTLKLYEESQSHMVLDRPRSIDCPVCLIQGMQDKDVPWETAVKIQKNFSGSEIDVVFVEDGDHRLSRPEDLELIDREIRRLCGIFG